MTNVKEGHLVNSSTLYIRNRIAKLYTKLVKYFRQHTIPSVLSVCLELF